MTMYDAGSMTVWVKATTEYGCADSAYKVITQTEPPTITLLSGDDNQKVAGNTAITQIKYVTTNASGATVTGLPDGVSGAWAADTYTISGTPSTTTTGAFTYTVTTTNSYGCIDASVSGTITVYPPGCIPSNLTLGEVGFTSTATYSRNGITWSAPVTVTYCQKAAYNGGSAGAYLADCIKTTAPAGDYISGCMVREYAAQLCPSPWRVPSQADMCQYLATPTGCGNPDQSTHTGMDGWVAGCGWHPTTVVSCSNCSRCANYWTGTTALSNGEWRMMYAFIAASAFQTLATVPFGYGFMLRCVQ
jgi:hypothetical protein